MIVFLAVIVGSIVIALFLPLIEMINKLGGEAAARTTGATSRRGPERDAAGSTPRRRRCEFDLPRPIEWRVGPGVASP